MPTCLNQHTEITPQSKVSGLSYAAAVAQRPASTDLPKLALPHIYVLLGTGYTVVHTLWKVGGSDYSISIFPDNIV